MTAGWETLDPEDDLVAMERSCMSTFVSKSQIGPLLERLYIQELQSTMAFVEKFAPSILLVEENVIDTHELGYLPSDEDTEELS